MLVKLHIAGVNIEVNELDAPFYERAGYVRDEVLKVEAPQPPEVPAEVPTEDENEFDPAEDPEYGEVEKVAKPKKAVKK
jgi:hypothetical protein